MPAVKTHNAELATRLVDEAGRLLASDGAGALTLRRLATVTGTSTMAVYTLFGDKQGLLAAMHREGFARLTAAARRAQASSDDPLAALAAQGVAYRESALANPHLYGLMFGTAAPGFRPDAEGEAMAEAAYVPLVEGVQRCLDAGVMHGAPAERIAMFLWAVSHGMVSLEIAGLVEGDEPERATHYRDALVYSAMPFLTSG
ncbi:MAG TPA: TetR/AcrR family transcriptional regulator [Mycobacteriales bacterium]|nr:TetR/AcrR family transcriptional regulator [Mycobacteriales bacterium]